MKTLLKVTLGVFILFVLMAAVVNLPVVQEKLVTYVTTFIMQKAGHRATLEGVKLNWFDTIELNGLVVYDTKNQPMIVADMVDLDFHLLKLLENQSINFDKGTVDHARVIMTRNAPGDQFNLTYMIDKIKEELARKKTGRSGKKFIVKEVELIDSEFLLDNTGRDSLSGRFDPNHFVLKAINGNLGNFTIDKGNVQFGTENLSCYDSATQFTIDKLDVNYLYTRQSMVFQNMKLSAGSSTVENSMIFEYDSPKSLKDFVANVKITANVKQSNVNLKDLGTFIPSVKDYDRFFRIKGYYEGLVTRFNTKNIVLEFGADSRIEGYFSMYGLPDFFETFINANITGASVNTHDLEPYLEKEQLQNILKFGNVKFDGRFSGFPNDFVSDGIFNTAIGKFDTDINVKINERDKDASVYSGTLTTNNLNLGRLFEDTATYQMLAFEGKLSGTGFTRASADVKVVADIKKIGYKGYEYKNISTNAHLTKDLFSGELKINDPNLQFDGSMSIDYRGEKDKLIVKANLDTANLRELNLADKNTFLSSELDVSIEGFQNDELVGEASFKDLNIIYDDRAFELEKLAILSEKDSLGRTIKINSTLLDAFIIGDFKPLNFAQDFGTMTYEYWLAFLNNPEDLSNYYAAKKVNPEDYYFIDLEVKLKDINNLIHLAEPRLSISDNAEIVGSFTGGFSNILEFDADIKQILYDDIAFRDNNISITASNFADTTQIDASIQVFSEAQYKKRKKEFDSLDLEIEWHENRIDFRGNLDQFQTENYMKVSGFMDLLPDMTRIKLNPSELKALNKIWTFSDDNEIIIKPKHYEFHNMVLFSGIESISANGSISKDEDENLFISFKNLDVDNINPFITKKLDGSLNGFIDLKDYYGERILKSRLNIRDFKINRFLIGDIASRHSYDNDNQRFETLVSLTSEDEKTLGINGYVYPLRKQDQLDLTADLKHANLNILEPFYDRILSDLQGSVVGKLYIKGNITKPDIRGGGVVERGILTLDYQKVTYSFSGEVNFDKSQINFEQINLEDVKGSRGSLSGYIEHNHFKDLTYNFRGRFTNFQVLNTQASDNNLFYGTANATGSLRIFGEGKNVTFKANALSNRDTKIFIPLNGSTEIYQENFIQFVQPKDSLQDEESPENVMTDPVTLNFDFDFEVTPDAYCEIIFDITSGDIIRGRGNGKLKLLASTDGDFEMYGTYDISEGGYNFTMYNIINKEFTIHPGSRITWTGDPYHADLDIKASYRQLASLMPIINLEIDEKSTELSRKYPALVYLFIKGDMMSPDIDFDIEITDYPQNLTIPGTGIPIDYVITAFYNKLRNDEQELKKQVFSLIVLKKFSEENELNVGSALENSVSEFISNQLSYWISQVDENLVVDFDVDLGSMSDEEFNTFQLRLSYSFFDGRLRITRDGNFSSRQDYNDPMNLIGDWTVEYLLTEDGKFRAKFYNKTNFNIANTINNKTTTSTGFSLMHTQSFDELFKKIKEKRDEELKKKKGVAQKAA